MWTLLAIAWKCSATAALGNGRISFHVQDTLLSSTIPNFGVMWTDPSLSRKKRSSTMAADVASMLSYIQ
jgi:hypothetical protein